MMTTLSSAGGLLSFTQYVTVLQRPSLTFIDSMTLLPAGRSWRNHAYVIVGDADFHVGDSQTVVGWVMLVTVWVIVPV